MSSPTKPGGEVVADAEALFATPDGDDSPLHQKLSSRSRKSVEDILESSKRRQASSEALLSSQRSARQQKLQSERAHEQEVKQRHDAAIDAVAETTARKQAHAEEARAERMKAQADRLKQHEERAEQIRQRKLATPQKEEGVPDDIPAGTTLARGDDDAGSNPDDENLLIDLLDHVWRGRHAAEGGARASTRRRHVTTRCTRSSRRARARPSRR